MTQPSDDSRQRIAQSDHGIKAGQIPHSVRTIIEELQQAGYEAYAVGGCIRDLVAGLEPKDFDVATSATPEQTKQVFRRCRLIGRRFRLAHVRIGRDLIEVATFRGNSEDDTSTSQQTNEGRILRDNVYGSVDEDAHRRDFTVNALFLDMRDMSIIDYVGGYEDLTNRTIRMIGDPEVRYHEDAVRMIRALRFSAKLGFGIEAATLEPISRLGHLFDLIPPARLFDESLKLFMSGHAMLSFDLLIEHGLMPHLFPELMQILETNTEAPIWHMIEQAMENTDERIAQGKPVTPAFLFATLLWPVMTERLEEITQHPKHASRPFIEQQSQAIEDTFRAQCKRIAVPRRYSAVAAEIWQMQSRFVARKGKRAWRLLQHQRFRAAYDFLLLTVIPLPEREQDAVFWTEIQELEYEQVRDYFAAGKQSTASDD